MIFSISVFMFVRSFLFNLRINSPKFKPCLNKKYLGKGQQILSVMEASNGKIIILEELDNNDIYVLEVDLHGRRISKRKLQIMSERDYSGESQNSEYFFRNEKKLQIFTNF